MWGQARDNAGSDADCARPLTVHFERGAINARGGFCEIQKSAVATSASANRRFGAFRIWGLPRNSGKMAISSCG